MIPELRNLMTSFPCLDVIRKSVNRRRAEGPRPNNLRKRSSVLIASGRNRDSFRFSRRTGREDQLERPGQDGIEPAADIYRDIPRADRLQEPWPGGSV